MTGALHVCTVVIYFRKLYVYISTRIAHTLEKKETMKNVNKYMIKTRAKKRAG
jgi:hypothetical protein